MGATDLTGRFAGGALFVGGVLLGAYLPAVFPEFALVGLLAGVFFAVTGGVSAISTVIRAPAPIDSRHIGPSDRMWLYEVLRYLARDSEWASNRPLKSPKWELAARSEFLRTVSVPGGLVAYGRQYRPLKEHAPRDIPPEFWRHTEGFNPFDIMAENVIAHPVYGGKGEAFTDIYFDRRAVQSVWRRRSLWSLATRHSPPERQGTAAYWKEQDAKINARAKELGAEPP